jgi:hypothetical protein
MANQSLARRQTSEVVVQQHIPGSVVERTQTQLQEVQGVILTAAVEYDTTRHELEAIVGRGGRSPGHQRTGALVGIYDSAVQNVVRQAVHDIITERPTEIVRTVSVPEPRKPWYQLLGGGYPDNREASVCQTEEMAIRNLRSTPNSKSGSWDKRSRKRSRR